MTVTRITTSRRARGILMLWKFDPIYQQKVFGEISYVFWTHNYILITTPWFRQRAHLGVLWYRSEAARMKNAGGRFPKCWDIKLVISTPLFGTFIFFTKYPLSPTSKSHFYFLGTKCPFTDIHWGKFVLGPPIPLRLPANHRKLLRILQEACYTPNPELPLNWVAAAGPTNQNLSKRGYIHLCDPSTTHITSSAGVSIYTCELLLFPFAPGFCFLCCRHRPALSLAPSRSLPLLAIVFSPLCGDWIRCSSGGGWLDGFYYTKGEGK